MFRLTLPRSGTNFLPLPPFLSQLRLGRPSLRFHKGVLRTWTVCLLACYPARRGHRASAVLFLAVPGCALPSLLQTAMKNFSSVTEPSGRWNSYRGDEESFFYRDVICTFLKHLTSIPSKSQTYLTARLWERRMRCWKVSKLCLKFDAHAVSPPT